MRCSVRDKGYRFPLHSLFLLRPGEVPDDPLHVLQVPEGRLAVRPSLLRRAASTRTADTERALHRALAHQRLVAALLEPCGFGPAWAGSVEHWWARLRELDVLRLQAQARGQLLLREQRGRLRRARQLLCRLALAAELGGVAGLRPRGRLPRGEPALLELLADAAARARAEAAVLAQAGFQAPHVAELSALAAALGPGRRGARAQAEAQRRQGGALYVVRGALLGDLSLLARAAAAVLPPDLARPLQRQALLPRRTAPSPAPEL